MVWRDDKPWFVLVDVCRVLGIENPRNVSARLDADEKDGVQIMDAIGRSQQTTIISLPGLFKLLQTSTKPIACPSLSQYSLDLTLRALAHFDHCIPHVQ